MYRQDFDRADLTSSERDISIQPSMKKACSDTAILTGAVRMSCSLSNNSKPQTRDSPNSFVQLSISSVIDDFSLDSALIDSRTPESKICELPLTFSGRLIAWNPDAFN